jgi:hypothetical protein
MKLEESVPKNSLEFWDLGVFFASMIPFKSVTKREWLQRLWECSQISIMNHTMSIMFKTILRLCLKELGSKRIETPSWPTAAKSCLLSKSTQMRFHTKVKLSKNQNQKKSKQMKNLTLSSSMRKTWN